MPSRDQAVTARSTNASAWLREFRRGAPRRRSASGRADRAGTRSPGGARSAWWRARFRRAPRPRCTRRRAPRAPAGSRARGTRYAPRAARAPPAPAPRRRSPASHIRSTRSAIRSSSSGRADVDADLDGVVHRVVAGQIGGERLAGDLDHFEGADDPAAVAGQDRAGRLGVGGRQPGVQGAGARAASSSRLQPGAYLGVGAGEVEDVDGRRARTARSRRPGRGCGPRRAAGRSRRGRASGSSATLAGSVTSQMSRRWCGMPPRSSGVSLAVPMSIPR